MLRKIIISFMIFLSLQAAVYSYSPEHLSNLEMVKYGQSFENDSLASRLMRLETDLFGMTQSGDIDSRLDMISQMIGSSALPPVYQPDNTYYPKEKKGIINRFLNNLSDDFSNGALTGFTPPLTSTGYVNDFYGNGFMNYTNTSGGYCPFHNTYHNNGFFNNRNDFLYGKNKYPNSVSHRHNFRSPRLGHNHNYSNFNSYANPYGYYRSPIPTNTYTNVLTRSGVHIIKD